MILCIGTTPAAQRVMVFRQLRLEEVNRAVTTLETAAGKSINVAKVLQTLGEQPLALSLLGGARGEFIRGLLCAKKIALEPVTVAHPTRLCITVLNESSGEVTELVEEGGAITAAESGQFLEAIRRNLSGARAVVMSGTIAPGAPPDLYRQCVEGARQTRALSVVDAQGTALATALEAGPGLVKPNRRELEATVGRTLADETAVLGAMRELSQRGAQRVVVTAGKETVLAFEAGKSWRIRPPTIRPVNPIGSGDAFTAGVVWRLVAGDDLGEACRWGAAAGAANALSLLPGELERPQVEQLAGHTRVELVP